VDGSDKIFINRNGALWTHVNWSFPPRPVSVNGTQWNPSEKNYMSTTGAAKFLPESFSLQSAVLEPIKGRDTIALEVCSNGVIVYLDDTPGGSDVYEFNVKFPPISAQLPPAPLSTVTNLKISGVIDGSDCIKITSREAALDRKYFSLPSGLTVNGIPWDATQTLVLTNDGPTQFLPPGIDFSTARVVSRQGRDLATAWGNKDALWVHFADNPNGADNYEIEIAFGQQ
jgi:hypothetical protein